MLVELKKLSFEAYERVSGLLAPLCDAMELEGSAVEAYAVEYNGKLYTPGELGMVDVELLRDASPLYMSRDALEARAREEAKKARLVKQWRFVAAHLPSRADKRDVYVYFKVGGRTLLIHRLEAWVRSVNGVKLRLWTSKHRCFGGLRPFGWFKQMGEYWPAVYSYGMFSTVYQPLPTVLVLTNNCTGCEAILEKLKEVGVVEQVSNMRR